jgi:hypothetical protein
VSYLTLPTRELSSACAAVCVLFGARVGRLFLSYPLLPGGFDFFAFAHGCVARSNRSANQIMAYLDIVCGVVAPLANGLGRVRKKKKVSIKNKNESGRFRKRGGRRSDHDDRKKKEKKEKSHMGQEAKRAARPARQTWPGGFARLLIISHCVPQH